jgi:hypothetical protein
LTPPRLGKKKKREYREEEAMSSGEETGGAATAAQKPAPSKGKLVTGKGKKSSNKFSKSQGSQVEVTDQFIICTAEFDTYY